MFSKSRLEMLVVGTAFSRARSKELLVEFVAALFGVQLLKTMALTTIGKILMNLEILDFIWS